MLELFAAVVKLIFGDWVVQMLLNLESLTILFDDLLSRGFWDLANQFSNVSIWSRENFKLSCVHEEPKRRNFLQESLEVKSPFIDKFDVFITNCLLGWKPRNWDTWPSLFQFLAKGVELIVSSLSLPITLFIHTFAIIHDMTIFILWVQALEEYLVRFFHQLIVLLKDFCIDLVFFLVFIHWCGIGLLFFLDVRHLF